MRCNGVRNHNCKACTGELEICKDCPMASEVSRKLAEFNDILIKQNYELRFIRELLSGMEEERIEIHQGHTVHKLDE